MRSLNANVLPRWVPSERLRYVKTNYPYGLKCCIPLSLNKIVAHRRVIPTDDFGFLEIGFSQNTL
jgi:hypothetical protein